MKISGTFFLEKKLQKKTIHFSSNGSIESVSEYSENADSVYEDSCIIFPGFGDIHIHAREDVSQKHIYKEDFISAGNAALNGGCVHVADMPNNPVPPIDDLSYKEKVKLTAKSPVHITVYAGIGPNTKPLSEMVPYKVFMGPSIGELYFKTNAELEEVIKNYRGQHVSFHCEDPEILEANKSQEKHEDRRPSSAELKATDFALYLIEKYELKGKLCHYSTGDGLQKIKAAKKQGINVTCEVTPTHLFFDRSVLTEENFKWFQMNPPLRDSRDKEILIDELKAGNIDYLATDHAPHSIEEKMKGISGISHLDTYGLFVTWLIKEKNVPLEIINQVCSENPGKFTNQFLNGKFGKGFGKIEDGYSASFTVLNLSKPHTVRREELKTKSGWSPFENLTFPGSVEEVWFHGKRRSELMK